jgi:hypothetical protein
MKLTLQTGTVEYLSVSVTADVTLDTQPVEFSFDRSTWHAATWLGTAGTTRSAQVLLDETNLPSVGNWPVFVRVTDSPEIPVMLAGGIKVL